jgi:hypothetical protein
MTLLKKIETIAAKAETTIGTPIATTATDAQFNAYDINLAGDIPVEAREGQGGFDRLQGVAGQYQGGMTFKTDLEWDGTVTLPDWVTVLLAGCGYVNSSGVITPRSEAPGTNVKTLTMAVYENGRKRFLAGAVGTFKLMMPTGRRAYIDWSFQGVWQPPIDAVILAPTYPNDTIIRFAAATLTFDGFVLCTESLEYDAGNVIKLRECASTDSGFISGIITDRISTVTGNPEAQLIADDDPWGDLIANTEAAMSIVLNGPGVSNITIAIPKAQLISVNTGEREGILTDDQTWQCNKNGANQDQSTSITFNNII